MKIDLVHNSIMYYCSKW